MLEKAWAKVHGSYERTAWGFPNLAMRDLTGAPAFSLPTNGEGMKERIVEWDFKKYIMCACAQFDEAAPEEKQASGIANQHAYGVISAINLTEEESGIVGGETILKVRNPWGKFEWTGDWSDNSDLWTPELIKSLAFTKEDDGTFWINFEDFCENFKRIQVCKVDDDAIFNHVECTQKRGQYVIQTLSVQEDGEITFSIAQKDKRCFPRSSKYGYSNCRLILCTQNQEYVAGTCGKPNRDLHLEIDDLEAGEYILFAECDWEHSHEDFVLTSYGSDVIWENTTAHENEEKHDFLINVFRDKCRKGDDKIKVSNPVAQYEAPGVVKYTDLSAKEGYAYIYYENKESDKVYTETINFTKFNGCTLLPSEQDRSVKSPVQKGTTA